MDGHRLIARAEARASNAFSIGLGQFFPFFIVIIVLGLSYVVVNGVLGPVSSPIVAHFPKLFRGTIFRFAVDIVILMLAGAGAFVMNKWKFTRMLLLLPIRLFQKIPLIGDIAHRGIPVRVSTGADGPKLMGFATTEIYWTNGKEERREVAVRLFSLLSIGTQYFPIELVEVIENISIGEVWESDLSGGASLKRHRFLKVRPWEWRSPPLAELEEMTTITAVPESEDF